MFNVQTGCSKNITQVQCSHNFKVPLKGTVSVILNGSPCKDCNTQFTTVPLKASSFQVLAWKPSAAKVTKSYSRRLPALERTKFSLLKSTHLTKNLKTNLSTFL